MKLVKRNIWVLQLQFMTYCYFVKLDIDYTVIYKYVHESGLEKYENTLVNSLFYVLNNLTVLCVSLFNIDNLR